MNPMNNVSYAHAVAQPRLLKKITPFDMNKALLTMGFGTWGGLEPGKEYITEQI